MIATIYAAQKGCLVTSANSSSYDCDIFQEAPNIVGYPPV
jgi:hypothetical protein